MKDGKQYLIGLGLRDKDLRDIEQRMTNTLSTAMENGMSLDRSGKAVIKKDMEVLLEYVRELTSGISGATPDIAKQLTGNLKNVLPMISGLADKMRQVNDSTDWMKQGFTFGEDIYTTIKALDTVQKDVADVRAEISELTTSLNPFMSALKANDPSAFFKKFSEGFQSVGNDAATMRATITKELNAAKSSGNDLKGVMDDVKASARSFTNKKATNFVNISSVEDARKEFDLLYKEYEKYGELAGVFGKGIALEHDIEQVKAYAKVLIELQNLSKNKFGKGLFDSFSSGIYTDDIKVELQEITQSIAATIKQAGDTLQRTVDGLNLKEVQLSVVLPEADAKKIEQQANDWVDKFNEKFKAKPVQLSVDMADPFKTYKSKTGKLTDAQKNKIAKTKQEALDALRGIANDETLEANFSGLDDPETSRILKKLADSFTKIRKGVELGQTSILEATKQWRSEIDKLLTLSFKWNKVDVGDGAQELLENLQRLMTDTPMEINVNKSYFIKQIEEAFKTAQFNINGSVVGGTPVSGGAPIILTGTPIFANSTETPAAPHEPPKTPPTSPKSSEQPKSEDVAQDAIEIVTKPANALTRAVEKLDAEIESLKEKRRLGYESVEQRKAAQANAEANIARYNTEKETADAARKIVLDSLIAAANAAKNADIKEYNSTAKDDKIKVLEGRKAKIDKIIKEQGDPSKLVVDAVNDFYENNDNQAKRRLKEIALIDKDLSAQYAEVINLEKEISKLNPATDGNKISELRGKIDAIKPEIDMLFGGVTESVVSEYVALEKQIENAKQRYAQTNSSEDKLALDGLEKRQKELQSGLSYLQNEKGVDKAFFEKFKQATDIEREIRSLDPIKDKSKMSDLKIQLKKIVSEMGNIFMGLKEKTEKELADVEAQLTEARKKYTLSNSEKDKKVVEQLEAKQKNLTTGQKAVGYLDNNRIKKQLFEQSGFRDYRGLDINASIQFVNEILRGSTTLADTLTHLSANGVNIKGNVLDNLVYFIPRVQEMMGIVAQSSQQWERTDELQQRFLRIADLLQKISGLFSIRGNSATIDSLQEFINVFSKVPTLAPVVDAAKNHLHSLLEMSNLVGDNVIYKEILGGNKVNSDLFKMLQGNYIEMPSEIQKELQKAIPSIDFSKLTDKDIDDDLRQAITDNLTAAFKSGGLDSNVFEQLKTGAPALQKFYEVLKLIVLYANQLQTGDSLYALTGHGKTGYIGKLQSQIGKDDSMVATVGSGADKKLYGLQTKNQNRYHAIPGTTPKSYDTKDFLSNLGIDKLQYEKFILGQGLFAERDQLQKELAEIMAKEEAEVDKVALQRIQARLDAIDGMLKKSGTTVTSEAEAKSRVKEINEQMFANMSLSRPEDVVKQEYGYDQTAYAKAFAERAKKVAALEKATPEMVEKLNQEIKELDAVLSNREVILDAVRTLYKDRELAEFNSGIAAKNAEKYKGYKSSRQHHRDVLDSTFNREGNYRDQFGNIQTVSEARYRFLTALQYKTMDSDAINSLFPDLEEYEDKLAELRSIPEDDRTITPDQIDHKNSLKARLSELKDSILNAYYKTEGWLLNDLLTREIQSVETKFNTAARSVVNDNADVNSHFDNLVSQENLRYNKQTEDIRSQYSDQIDMSSGMSEVRAKYEQERRELVSKKYNEKMQILKKAQEEELKAFENEINAKAREPKAKYQEAKAAYEKNETKETEAELKEAEKAYLAVRAQGNVDLSDFKQKQEKVLTKAKTDNWNEANSEVPNKLEELEQAARDAANQTVEGVVKARKEALRQELTQKFESGQLSAEEAETQRLQGFADIDKQAQNGVIKGAITKARNQANKALENFVKGVAEQYGITADLTEKTLAESIIKGDKSAEQAELDAATTEHKARLAEINDQRAKAIKEQEDRNAEAVMNNMKNLDEAMEKATSSLQTSNGYWLKDSTIVSQIGKGERAGAAKDKKDADAKARWIQDQIDNLMKQGQISEGMVEGTEQLGEVQRKQTEAMRANANEVEKQTELAQRSVDVTKQYTDATKNQQQYYTGGFVGGGVAINTNGLAQETTLRGIWQLLNGGPPQGGWGNTTTSDESISASSSVIKPNAFASGIRELVSQIEYLPNEAMGFINSAGKFVDLVHGTEDAVNGSDIQKVLAEYVNEQMLLALHNHPYGDKALSQKDVAQSLANSLNNANRASVRMNGSLADGTVTLIDTAKIPESAHNTINSYYKKYLLKALGENPDVLDRKESTDVFGGDIGIRGDIINNPEKKAKAEKLMNDALIAALDEVGHSNAFKQFDVSSIRQFVQQAIKPAQKQVAKNVVQSGAQAAVEASNGDEFHGFNPKNKSVINTLRNIKKGSTLTNAETVEKLLQDGFIPRTFGQLSHQVEGSGEEIVSVNNAQYEYAKYLHGIAKQAQQTPVQQPVEPVPTETAEQAVQQTVPTDPVDVPVEPVTPAKITLNPNAKLAPAKKTAAEEVMDALRAGYKSDPKFKDIEGEPLLYDAMGKINNYRNRKDHASDQALRDMGNAYVKLQEVVDTKIVEHLGPAMKSKIENIIQSAKFVLDENGVEIGNDLKGEVITPELLKFLQPRGERYKLDVGKIIGKANNPIMMRNGELLQSAFVSAHVPENKAEKDKVNEALGIEPEEKKKSSKKSKDDAKAAEAQASAEAKVTAEDKKQLDLAQQKEKIEEKTTGDLQAQAQATSDANKAKIEPAPIESASGIPQGTGGGLPAFVNTLSQLLNVVAKDTTVQEIIKALGNGIKSSGSGGKDDDGEKKSLNLSADEALARITAQVNTDYRGAVKTGNLRANANSYSVDFWRQSAQAQEEAEEILKNINQLEDEGKANTEAYNNLIQQRNSLLQKQEKITLRINKDTGEITSKIGIENFAVGANAAEKELQHTQGVLSQLQEASALQFNQDGSLTSQNQSINNWIQSMQALQVQRDKFASEGTLFDSKNQQVLSQMTAQTAQYRKEIMDLLRVEGKFGGDVVDTFSNPQALVAQKEVYNKLLSIATATGKVKMETVKFDDTTNTLSYTVEKSKNQVQDMTLHMNSLSGAVSQQVVQTKHVDSAWQAFGKSLKGKWQEVARYLTTFGSIYRVWGIIKQGVGYVKEIDTALTELKKVTNQTDREYAQFLKTMSTTGAAVGATVKDLTNSAADWARLGYNLKQAGELAKNTAILMNVSEFEDVSKATDTLISSLQAFKKAGQDVGTFSMEIIDKYNEVGNNYAISTSDLAESLTRSSAALVAANNSLEESIAMTTAANTTIQDPESVGNALKVVSMRIRGVKSELEEAGEDTENMVTNTAKLQEKIMALTNIDGNGGIDILTDAGEFKSTYEILLAISKVWQDMDDTSQAALLELVAGKTRGSVVAALFQNGDVLEEAYKSASEASGSAMHELETYLDSVQGKLDQFTNATQTMWNNILNSNVIKKFVSLGTILVNLADKVGVIRLLFMGLSTILMRKSGITSIGDFFKAGAISAEEASKKLEELKTKYAELEGSKSPKNLRKQDKIAQQMKPYEAIVEGAKKANKAQENLIKSQDKLTRLQNGLKYAQEHGYPTKSINNYQRAVDEAKQEVSKCKEEVEKCEIANKKLGKSAQIGWTKFKSGIASVGKALWSIGKQLFEMYAITAALDVLRWVGEGFVNWADGLHKSAEEAQEELDEAKNKFEAIESEIDGLNAELETTNKAIDELTDKLTLSFTEQEELDRLKAISDELEKQIQFQETLKKAESKGLNSKTIYATKKYLNETSFDSDKSRSERQEKGKQTGELIGNIAGIVLPIALAGLGTVLAGPGGTAVGAKIGTMLTTAFNAKTMFAAIGVATSVGKVIGGAIGSNSGGKSYDSEESVAEAIANMKATREGFKKDIKEAIDSGDAKAYNEATEALNKYDATMADHMSVIAQNANSFNWETATEAEKKQMQEMLNLVDAYNLAMGGKDAKVNALDRLFGEDANELVQAFRDKIKNDIKNGEAVDFQEMIDVTGLDDDLETLGITTQDVADYFTQLGEAGADAIEEIDVSDFVSELAKVEGALESVQSIIEEFKTEGIVSASTLDGLDESIKKLDAFDAYAEALMSGTATMADVKVATENLAKELLDNADNIDKDTRLTYIAQLEQVDVENATELVDSYMNNSFWNSSEFANFKGNAEELIELAKEYGVVLEHTQELENLMYAKQSKDTARTKYQDDLVKYETMIKQQADEIEALGEGLYKYNYDTIVDMMNLTGDFSGYSAEEVQPWLDENIAKLKYDLEYQFGEEAEDVWNKLFPTLSEGYSVELDPDVVASKQKWDEAEKKFQELFDKMNLSVTPRVDMNPADTIEEISEIESGFESLSGAYNEFLEEGVASAGTLAGLKDTFDVVGMKDEYAKLVTVLGNSNSTIEEVKASLLDLANAYLNTIDVTDQLDASEKAMIIEQLTRLGVENAQEWLNARINAYEAIWDAYQVDLNNFNTLEEAKTGIVVNEVANRSGIQANLVDDLCTKYGIDLSQFVNMEAGKVEAAKEAAKQIAKAHFASASAAAYNEEVSTLDVVNNADDARTEQRLARKYKSGQLHSTVIAEYNDVMKIIDSIGSVDVGANLDAWFGNDTGVDWGKFKGLGDDSGSDSSKTELDWLDHYFTQIENKIKEKEADLENVMSADIGSISKKNTIIDGIIDLYERKMSLLENAIKAYENRATALFNGFSSDIQTKIQNGSIDIHEYDDKTAEKIQTYFDYITKASDFNIELDGVKVTVADFSLQKFDNASTAFDNEIEEKFQSDQDVIEAEIGYLEEQGKRVSPERYEELIKIQKEEQKVLENKKKTLENILATEIAAGHVQIGSEQWYEMTNAINDVDEALIASKNDIESFQNSINEIYWDNFEKLIDQIDAVNSELSNLFDLLSEDDKVVDEFGNWTDEGIASLGLLAQQMENAQAKADEYAKAIKDLDKDYAAGKYSLDEYNEKMAELKDSQLSEIKNIEDAKDAMVDLNKVRVDAVKEAIDKEIEALEEKNEKLKEELDLEKEQYEWQKSVAEKEKSIADIQRRLNALAGDSSASAIAERRKLQAELAEAQAEMDDMWYEHSIEEQQKSLDESLENYKENKEDEKEALDEWLEEEEKVIQESFDLFNSNVGVVASVLSAFEQEHGIKLSEAVTDPWKSGIDAMEAYRQKLAEMKQEQEDAKQNAEDTADDIIESVNKPQTTTPTVGNTPSGTASSTKPTQDATTGYREYQVKEYDTLSDIAQNELGSASRWQEIYNLNKDVISNPSLIYPGQKIKLPHYAKGTMGAEYDHWAMVDELGPELQLVPDGSGRLSYITRGTSVIPHDLSEKLVDLALDPTKVLEQSRPAIGAPHITTNNFDIDLSFGSLVHVDHCDQNTLPDLQKMVRSEFDNMMKTVNQKLKRK